MCTGRPCTRVLRVLYMCEAGSARAAVAVLERSRSRLRPNSLFGDSQVPGELCFHHLPTMEFSLQSFGQVLVGVCP